MKKQEMQLGNRTSRPKAITGQVRQNYIPKDLIDDIKAEQQMLKDQGFYTGKIDGIVGNLTQEARRKLQSSIGKESKIIARDGGAIAGDTAMGALGGAATGAGIGLAIGGPFAPITAAVGAGIGGLVSYFKARNQEDKQDDFKREQAAMQKRNRFEGDSLELAQYDDIGSGNFMYEDGGEILPLNSNMSVAKGATHEQGGIALNDNVEVEDEEVIMEDGDSTKVFSDNLGFSPMAQMLGQQKAILEQKLSETMSSIMTHGAAMEKNSDKHVLAGNERKFDGYTHRAEMISEEISSIDEALNKIFEQQQSINGDASNDPQQGGMPQGGMPQEGGQPEMESGDDMGGVSGMEGMMEPGMGGMMRDGGRIKAADGFRKNVVMPFNPYGFNVPMGKFNLNTNYNYRDNPIGKENYRKREEAPPINAQISNAPPFNLMGISPGFKAPTFEGDLTGGKGGIGKANLNNTGNPAATPAAASDMFDTPKSGISNPQLASGLLMSAGNFLTNQVTQRRMDRIEVPKPVYNKAYMNDASIDVSDILDGIDTDSASTEQYINRNVANDSVARGLMTGIGVQKSKAKSSVLGEKGRAERQIQAGNLANIQQTQASNNAILGDYKNQVYNKEMGLATNQSAINAGAMGDIRQSITNQDQMDLDKMRIVLQAMSQVDNEFDNDILPFIKKNFTAGQYRAQLEKQGMSKESINKRLKRFNIMKNLYR